MALAARLGVEVSNLVFSFPELEVVSLESLLAPFEVALVVRAFLAVSTEDQELSVTGELCDGFVVIISFI